MFCPHCGTELPENTKFCSGCGASLGGVQQNAPVSSAYDRPYENSAGYPNADDQNYYNNYNAFGDRPDQFDQGYQADPGYQGNYPNYGNQDNYGGQGNYYDQNRYYQGNYNNNGNYGDHGDNGNYGAPEKKSSNGLKLMIPVVVASVCCVCMAALVMTMFLTKKDDGGIKTDDDKDNGAVTVQTTAQTEAPVTDGGSETTAQNTETSDTEAQTSESVKETEKATTTTTPATTKKTTTTTDKYKQTVTPEYSDYIGIMYVNTKKDNLSCRIGPGYDYSKSFSSGIPKGAGLYVYAEQYDSVSGETWAYIYYNDHWGWCTEKYLSWEPPVRNDIVYPEHYTDYEYRPHFTVVVDDLKFRTGPGTEYDVLDTFYKGTKLEEYGFNDYDYGKWIYTCYNGQYGWVMAYRGYWDPDNFEYSDDYKLYCEFEGGAAKPVIYLYPEKETDVSVKLTLKTSDLSTTYPRYDNGWSVTAYPDGTLVNKADGRKHPYLFWDSVNDRTHYDMSKGFVVKGDETEEFLKEKLAYMGLTEEEANEFIVYWLPRMEHNKYNLISFQSDEYTENAQLDINPKPDSMLRVFMAYKPLDKKITVPEQKLSAFERKGFTVVEWGGTELK